MSLSLPVSGPCVEDESSTSAISANLAIVRLIVTDFLASYTLMETPSKAAQEPPRNEKVGGRFDEGTGLLCIP
jgi:hypothetical protein